LGIGNGVAFVPSKKEEERRRKREQDLRKQVQREHFA
jgi:hypothetical protein